MTARGLLVCGTASNAGKTTVVAALCRSLARRGLRVAPFKAQNMSLNSGVTASGEEIARAQLLQADAARVPAEVAMNPILVKPGTDRRAHLVVNGRPAGEIDATQYVGDRSELRRIAADAYRDLAARFDTVIAEGAGSAAEINLRSQDIANLGLAHSVDIPVVLVSDIDRGGVFASLIGTLACLDERDRERIVGFVINRFRGDPSVLQPGLDELMARTGVPVLGVLPYDAELRLDAEDSLATEWAPRPIPPVGEELLRIAVVRLPRASNLTDFEPLAAEPGVVLSFADVPQQMAGADLVVLPGTRTTVADLGWLRDNGFVEALRKRADEGLPVLGICGGYQMLGGAIDDRIESSAGEVAGMGLLPVTTKFLPDKQVAQCSADLAHGQRVTGYQIHHGRVSRIGGEPLFADEGCRVGAVAGTTWHGLFDSDDYRREFLVWVGELAGRRFVPAATSWRDKRDEQLDRLADAADLHLSALLDRLLLPVASGGPR